MLNVLVFERLQEAKNISSQDSGQNLVIKDFIRSPITQRVYLRYRLKQTFYDRICLKNNILKSLVNSMYYGPPYMVSYDVNRFPTTMTRKESKVSGRTLYGEIPSGPRISRSIPEWVKDLNQEFSIPLQVGTTTQMYVPQSGSWCPPPATPDPYPSKNGQPGEI